MGNTLIELYESLGFEQVETEDGQAALGIELSPEGKYGLVTDSEGVLPQTLKQEIVFACYSPEDSFLWSASFKNTDTFRELWASAAAAEDKLAAIIKHREANQTF